MDAKQLVPVELIANKLYLIRGHKVMLDKDLSQLYGVSTSVLNKAVSRNLDRFPSYCMSQLTTEEFSNMKCHFGTSSWGGTRKLPRAFTVQGVAMLLPRIGGEGRGEVVFPLSSADGCNEFLFHDLLSTIHDSRSTNYGVCGEINNVQTARER